MSSVLIIAVIVALLVGIAAGLIVSNQFLRKNIEKRSANIIEEAKEKAEVLKRDKILQAKEKFMQLKSEHDSYVSKRNSALNKAEERIKQKENSLNQKNEILSKKNKEVKRIKSNLETQLEIVASKQKELDSFLDEKVGKLEEISGLSAEKAKSELMESMKEDAKVSASNFVKDILEEAKMSADKEAKNIIIKSIQRTAAETTVENCVSVFTIENDEIKGRIIGREGRNIRALENATGVEIVIDDSPETVLISGFDPMRREIARLSLHKLVADGRIHPGRIEEIVSKTTKQIEKEIAEIGKTTCIDLGIHNMHHELQRLVGKMKYRSSYGQNLLQHSREVANLCALMASEIGLNPKLAKRAGLLHDIGKVSDTESEMPHALLGMKIAEKYKEKKDVLNAIGSHHEEIEMTTLLSPIVQACDAISGARPGARREIVESYIQRLNKLEEIAMSYSGVEKTYAIQAGRELRVIVGAESISDVEANQISYDISRKIQDEMTYPGQIKVTVIRETRAVNYAK